MLISNPLCYPAARSKLQPFSKSTRGVVNAPSVEAPPSVGGSPMFTLPAGSRGGAQPDSLGSAWLLGAAAPALSQDLSCSGNTTRNCNPSQSRHPEMLPLAAPFTICTPPAQAQHRRPLCYRMQDCAPWCIINLIL